MTIPAREQQARGHVPAQGRTPPGAWAALTDAPGSQPHPGYVLRRAHAAPRALTPGDVLRLQRTLGNRAVGRLLAGRGAPVGALQRDITHTAAAWFEDAAGITAPVGPAAEANAQTQVNKYLVQYPVATGGRTFTAELNRVKPFISNGDATALDNGLSAIRLSNLNGWQRATTLARIDALGALINAAAAKITLAGGEVAHANFRTTYGGTVDDLNAALALAGDAATLQQSLDDAQAELVTGRAERVKRVDQLLPFVRKALQDRANGPTVRGWGHRANGPVVVFWVNGVAGYWDFAEVHCHVNRAFDAHTRATAGDGNGHYVAERSVPGDRYVRAVNVRVPYSGVAQGTDVAVNDPLAILCLQHGGYDPARFDEAQGTLADF
ncbi:MAG: hypothetical protein JWM27_3798 [Gemmatimonadetes bacterium]|nr:hypothetical protein [Gemmatimonadota bacterium]